MAYERIEAPKGSLYHYTKTDRLEAILKDGRIRRFGDQECWFCTSLADTLRLMEMTVMLEGHPYVDVQGMLRKYPAFVPEDYVILRLEPRYQNGDWVRWNQELPPGCSAELLAQAKEFSELKKRIPGRPEVLPKSAGACGSSAFEGTDSGHGHDHAAIKTEKEQGGGSDPAALFLISERWFL